MKLNRTGSIWDRNERNKINDNWETIEQLLNSLNNLVVDNVINESQLAQIIEVMNGLIKKGELSLRDININLGKIGLEYLSEDVIKAIAGDAPVNAIPADNSITTKKLADKSVTPNKLTMMKKTRNLFDGVYYPIYIASSDPIQYRNATGSETPKTAIVKVEPNKKYTVKIHDINRTEQFRIAALESIPEPSASWKNTKRNISIQTVGVPEITFTTQENENYIMILVSYSGKEYKMQVEEGEHSTEYITHSLVPYELLELEKENEFDKPIEEVHKKLNREQIVPLVFGTTEETPTFSGGLLSYDYSNKKSGDRSYKIDSISITTGVLSFDINTHTDPVSAVGFWAYIPEPEKITALRVKLHKNDGSPVWSADQRGYLEYSKLNKGWNYLRYPTYKSDFNGLEKLNKIEFNVVPKTVPCSVSISNAWLETSKKAKMIFVEDAQFKTFYDIAYPDLRQRNIPVTWALRIVSIGTSLGTVDEQITEEQIRQLSKENNNSITFHSFGTKFSADMTPEETKEDVIRAQKWLLSRGYSGGVFKGAWFQNTAPNHEAAHDYLVTSGTPISNPNLTIWPFVKKYEVPRIVLHGTGALKIDSLFEALKKTRGLAVFYTHGVSNDRSADIKPSDWDYFMQKVDQALAEGWLEPTTFEMLNEQFEVYDEMKF